MRCQIYKALENSSATSAEVLSLSCTRKILLCLFFGPNGLSILLAASAWSKWSHNSSYVILWILNSAQQSFIICLSFWHLYSSTLQKVFTPVFYQHPLHEDPFVPSQYSDEALSLILMTGSNSGNCRNYCKMVESHSVLQTFLPDSAGVSSQICLCLLCCKGFLLPLLCAIVYQLLSFHYTTLQWLPVVIRFQISAGYNEHLNSTINGYPS